ncbi:hypothetical protein NC651_008138 [Populus alba x Populus x berolinensis]|nr:hypothetical protein NC651_008138 [Populus alba x Populus x berolinensis]
MFTRLSWKAPHFWNNKDTETTTSYQQKRRKKLPL